MSEIDKIPHFSHFPTEVCKYSFGSVRDYELFLFNVCQHSDSKTIQKLHMLPKNQNVDSFRTSNSE